MENINRCNYRGCIKVLINRRPECKFCSRKCKELEKTYKRRDQYAEKVRMSEIVGMLIEYENNQDILKDPMVLELFRKYGNK